MADHLYRTVSEVAEYFAVNVNKVRGWIDTNELAAIDVSQNKGERPRWRIHVDEIERFELERRSVPKPRRGSGKPRGFDDIPKYV